MNRKFFKRIISLQVILLIASLGFVQNTLAVYVDVETSVGNNIGASSLDAEVVSEESELQLPSVAQNMIARDSVTRTSEMKNVGGVDFLYNVKFVKTGGDDAFCDGLQLEATQEENIVYVGDLSEFDINVDVLESGQDDDWNFLITMPGGLATDENCEFDFEYTAWQTNFATPGEGGWVDTEKLDNNKIHAGIENPLQTGYNENNGDAYDTPHYPDANELACTGDVTNINGISVHWRDVSNGNENVKYQRQFKVGAGNWRGNEIYTNPYTNYRSFGGGSGNEGIYGSRVRAWVDIDGDNIVDGDEMVSEWSNECFIEFDKTAPAMPTGLQRIAPNEDNKIYECGGVSVIQKMWPDWDDNTESDFDHYEYTSFNAPNGAVGLNEEVFYTSIFEYNGGWLPHDGTYGFAVRAVDKAGNKSDWSLEGKTLGGSCQITYDNTGPELTIDAIKYPNGTVEPDKFVTNYNTPTIVGEVADEYSSVALVKLTIDGQIYNADIVGNEWSVDITNVLADGTYEMSIEASDALGNTSTKTQEIKIDTVAPTAKHTYYKDGIKIDDFEVYNEGGRKFSSPVVYVASPSQLSFTAEYMDTDTAEHPSVGLYWDSYAIFEAQDDGSFRFSQDGKRAYCSWRREPNLVDISDEPTFSLSTKESFENCIDTLPEGEYYITHHIYDYATRKDIPSINQFRDVLGLHFIIDTAPEVPSGIRILDNNGNDKGCDGTVNNRNITVDWADNSEPDFKNYDYQIREENTIANPVESEFSGAIRDEDGYYKYRVRAVDERGNESDWTDWCGVTLDRSVASTALSGEANEEGDEEENEEDANENIVLNEFLPKPAVGEELVELYNIGNEAVDVDGWYITDKMGPNKHRRKIDDAHTNTGSTIMEPGEYLIIQNYASFHLNDGGDTIKLFDDENELVDSYEYKKSEVELGKTIARDWDDDGKWVDPIPTFGAPNNISNDKSDFRKYYEKACFDKDEKLLCEWEFVQKLGIVKKQEKDIKKEDDKADINHENSGDEKVKGDKKDNNDDKEGDIKDVDEDSEQQIVKEEDKKNDEIEQKDESVQNNNEKDEFDEKKIDKKEEKVEDVDESVKKDVKQEDKSSEDKEVESDKAVKKEEKVEEIDEDKKEEKEDKDKSEPTQKKEEKDKNNNNDVESVKSTNSTTT